MTDCRVLEYSTELFVSIDDKEFLEGLSSSCQLLKQTLLHGLLSSD
jgi:hypothetical protein